MKTILNLTQHPASPEQQQEGVFEPENKKQVQELLTFDSLPSKQVIQKRAVALAKLARAEADNGEGVAAMIGGAPFLMPRLKAELEKVDIIPLFAFSQRESVEEIVDGKTVKKSVFRHIGFVEA